jgi:DNA-binding transcriptional MerR regulator
MMGKQGGKDASQDEARRGFPIGELAEKVGVTHRTIHFYEREGLITPASREGVGYRYYDDTSVERLKKILQLKKIGLSLDEIRDVIDLYFDDASIIEGKKRVLGIIKNHLTETDKKINILQSFRDDILKTIVKLETLIAQSTPNDGNQSMAAAPDKSALHRKKR